MIRKKRTDDLILGTTVPPGGRRHVRLTPAEQAYHATIWGRSGSGKSRLLQALFLQHLNLRHGVGLIDPHHDLASGILSQLVAGGFFADERAFDRLVYLDFGNGAVVPFNVLAGAGSPYTRAHHVLEAMIRVWPELQRAPSFQTLVLSSFVVLIENELPITFLHQLLTDAAFREQCLRQVRDPLIQQSFQRFGKGSGQAQEAGSALRRAFLLSFNELTRLSLGQPDTVLNLRQIMDEGTSLLVNLGNIQDTETRRLIGALLLVQIEQAALSRTDIPEGMRRPWTVLVDEWPSMAASDRTLGSILDQTRKFGLRLYLAAQSMGQVSSDRLEGALENCRLTIVFGLGRDSAVKQGKALATPQKEEPGLLSWLFPTPPPISVQEQFQLLTDDIQILDSQEAYVKLHTEPPVKIRTLTVPNTHPSREELARVLATYRRRYQRSREEAEARSAHLQRRWTPMPAEATAGYQLFGGRPGSAS